MPKKRGRNFIAFTEIAGNQQVGEGPMKPGQQSVFSDEKIIRIFLYNIITDQAFFFEFQIHVNNGITGMRIVRLQLLFVGKMPGKCRLEIVVGNGKSIAISSQQQET